jgi:putative endonuclease
MAKIEKDNHRQIFGAWGEAQAAAFLEKKGLKILARNYRTNKGELDLIARDGEDLVFIEVKTRKNLDFGYPEEAVTANKIGHLIEAAEAYLFEHIEEQSWRLDVIAIQGIQGQENPDIEWFQDVQ